MLDKKSIDFITEMALSFIECHSYKGKIVIEPDTDSVELLDKIQTCENILKVFSKAS